MNESIELLPEQAEILRDEIIRPAVKGQISELYESIPALIVEQQRKIAELIAESVRTELDPQKFADFAKQLIEDDGLRRQTSYQTTLIYLDAHAIIGKVWAEQLAEQAAELDALLKKKALLIQALETERRLKKEIELAEMSIALQSKKDEWQLKLFRLHSLKLHIVAAVAIGGLGLLVGLNWGDGMLCHKGDAVCAVGRFTLKKIP